MHQHVGIFAQRRARGGQHVLVAAAHLALADERRAALVHDVDFALDRDHMVAPRAVDEIDEARTSASACRSTAGRRRARDLPARWPAPEFRARARADRSTRRAPASAGTRRPDRDDRGSSCSARGRRPRCRRSTRSPRPCAAPSWLRSGISVSSSDSTSLGRRAWAHPRAPDSRRPHAPTDARPWPGTASTRRARPRAAAADRGPERVVGQ